MHAAKLHSQPACGPCRMMAPAFAQAAERLESWMRLALHKYNQQKRTKYPKIRALFQQKTYCQTAPNTIH